MKSSQRKQFCPILIGGLALGGYYLYKKHLKGSDTSSIGALKPGRKVLDKNQIRDTYASALIYDGKYAGKLLGTYSKSGVVTIGLWIWKGPLGGDKIPTDRNVETASGYGYDKQSQAVYQILKGNGIEPKKVSPGNGLTRQEFEAWGYEFAPLIN